MARYGEFAEVYAEGDYTRHSSRMLEITPGLIDEYDIEVDKVLDLACGEGTFARGMAEKGYSVKGIDLSENLIRIARNRSEGENTRFEVGDMREFSEGGYDLVTCWYDSLNYLKTISELKSAFENVKSALKKDGYFIFDMNTYYWLSEGWPSDSCYVANENEEVFEVHRTEFNENSKLFALHVTGFKKKDGEWNKFDEKHEEKAYRLEEIEDALRETGFKILDIFGNIDSREALSEKDSRVWFVTKVA